MTLFLKLSSAVGALGLLFSASVAQAEFGTSAFAVVSKEREPTVSDSKPFSTSSLSAATIANGPATADSYADLTTGKIGVSTNSLPFTRSEATAAFRDALTFTVAEANAETETAIGLSWLIHGGFITNPSDNFLGLLLGQLNFGGASTIFNLNTNGGGTFEPIVSGFMPGSWVQESAGLRFTGTYKLTGLATTLDTYSFLGLTTAGVIAGDFGRTASLSFTLPQNVTLTSQSGTFLSAASVPGVPEPEFWALMLIGFGAVGLALRRRGTMACSSGRSTGLSFTGI